MQQSEVWVQLCPLVLQPEPQRLLEHVREQQSVFTVHDIPSPAHVPS